MRLYIGNGNEEGMITLLAKLCIKKETEEEKRKAYGTLCGSVGIFLNICLFIGKYIGGVISGSVAIMADAFNNLSDAGSSFVTLVGFWFAGKKPDSDHPFGHGRFEYISGFVVSMAILLMGVELARTSVGKIIHPQEIDTTMAAFVILLISVCVKVYMFAYNYTIGKKIHSMAMAATALDSISDAVATMVVFFSMLIAKYIHINVDGISGLIVSVFILYTGYSAARETISPLLGRAPDPEVVEKIKEIVNKYEDVVGMHDLVIHDYGPGRMMVSLHAEVSGAGNIFVLHDAIDRLEKHINKELCCETVVHMDPVETDNQQIQEIKRDVENKIRQYDEAMSIHDFRVVPGKSATNLLFDLVVPYNKSDTKEQLENQMDQLVKELDSQYHAIIHIDRA